MKASRLTCAQKLTVIQFNLARGKHCINWFWNRWGREAENATVAVTGSKKSLRSRRFKPQKCSNGDELWRKGGRYDTDRGTTPCEGLNIGQVNHATVWLCTDVYPRCSVTKWCIDSGCGDRETANRRNSETCIARYFWRYISKLSGENDYMFKDTFPR